MGDKFKVKEAEAAPQRKAEANGWTVDATGAGELRRPHSSRDRTGGWAPEHSPPKSGARRAVQEAERREAGAGEQLQVWALRRRGFGGRTPQRARTRWRIIWKL